MSTYLISSKLQQVFAHLSGDFNPMHVDAVAARRLISGRPVVHGIHLVLWGLDTWLSQCELPVTLLSLHAVFSKPVDVGSTATC